MNLINTKYKILGVSLLFGVVLILSITMFLPKKHNPSNSPNVIILLVDCLRADHVGSYGYSRNTTPNIDKFSKDAVIFTQAISQSTFTKTSVASLFTSRYPYQHGIYKGGRNSQVLGEEEITLAELLLQNGFLTVAWVKNATLSSSNGFSQGFIEYNHQPGNIKIINEKFTKWINKVSKDRKFFAYIHYIDLHDPYRPKPPYDTMFGVYSEDIYSGIDFKEWRYYRDKILGKRRKLEKRDVDQLIAYYDGKLVYIDSQIGLLLEELRKAGLYDNSLIILTADHGDGFMEHGFISHSTIPYDELIKVPLIIKFPNSLYRGKVVESQVRSIDIMPTILDFLKINIDSNLEGFSLLNYLNFNGNTNNKIDFPKYAYSEVGFYEVHPIVSIRTERFKYIDFQDKKDEFYDLSADPKEQNNIIDLKRDDSESFYRIALDIREKRKKGVKEITPDKETIEELKALGYVE